MYMLDPGINLLCEELHVSTAKEEKMIMTHMQLLFWKTSHVFNYLGFKLGVTKDTPKHLSRQAFIRKS